MKNTQSEDSKIVRLMQLYIENRCSDKEKDELLSWLKQTDCYDPIDSILNTHWERIMNEVRTPDQLREKELQNEFELIRQKIRGTKKLKKHKPSGLNWLLKVAAVILLLLGIGTSIYKLKDPAVTSITYTEFKSAHGKIKKIKLTDGTLVTLNSGSSLKLPNNFNNKSRFVQMEGEAFFDVAKNAEKPFIIESGDATVKVLGTSFNVKAYKEDKLMAVTVATGKVMVNIDAMDLQLKLLPNEHLSVDKNTSEFSKTTIEENNYSKWISGILYFDKEPLDDVIKELNRKYDKKVILSCKSCNQQISGSHDNKSLEAVIDAICFTTGLKYTQNGNTIIIHE